MERNHLETSSRKKDHIDLCLTEDVSFKKKSNGFEEYDFLHDAATEVDPGKINLETKFFGKKISLPFLISCMTGGTDESFKINTQLATAAQEMNIPVGVGSQRQALENKLYHNSFKTILKNAPDVPKLSNLGAAQISLLKGIEPVKRAVEMIDADALVIHLNPAQEMLQNNGEPFFPNLLKNIEMICSRIDTPVIVKEVGHGIGSFTAKRLLNCGVKGIDVAGAGGTSWTAVELLRNKNITGRNFFHDWGLPTSYCVRTVADLKKKYKFLLIASGGVNHFSETAKALALGADITAQARKLLQTVKSDGVEGVISYITDIFNNVKQIMFLTNSKNLKQFRKNKIIRKKEMI